MRKLGLLLTLIPAVALAGPYDRPKVTHNNKLQVSVQDRVRSAHDTRLQSLYSVQLPHDLPADSPFRGASELTMVVKMEAQVQGRSQTLQHVIPLKNVRGWNPNLEFFADGTASNAALIPAGAQLTSRKVFIYAAGAEYTNYGQGVPVALPPPHE